MQADAGKRDGVVQVTEPARQRRREFKLVEPRVVHVAHPAAFQADEVVVAAGVGIEACLGLRAGDPARQADADKGFQDPVDRGAGESAELRMKFFVELVGVGVIGAPGQRGKNGPALQGLAEAVLAAESIELPLFLPDEFISFDVGLPGHFW